MPNEPPPPSSARIGDEEPSDRLDSWKDIAAYLKRDVSTVQRWEKRERMPVHRHVHDRLGTVYGFRPELDAWWRGRGSGLAQQQAPAVETTATPTTVESGEDSQPHVPPDPGDHANPGHVRWARRWLVLAGLGAVVLVTIAYVSRFERAGDRTKPEIGSLAVLPLDNLSDDPTQEYVADGMTEALITELGKIGSLRVIARTSVMKYKGTHTPPSKVARELGVQALVAGSVLRSGDRVRITAQLIDPDSDRPTWSDVYERNLRDVLTLQREVTVAIAGHVRARLTAPEQARLGKLRPVNPEAYESVLRARYLSVRTTDADSQAAIALLEHAVALDPEFAPAYAELAVAHVVRLTFVTPEETGELEQKAFAAAEKALSLDPDLPEAYLARGDLLWTHSHHFAHERAAQEFRRALSLNPNSDGAHRRLARVYVHVGFFEEALQHASIALAINPSNAQALNSRAQAFLWMGKDEEALATFLSIPGPVLPELVEANTVFTLLRLGRREEASLQLKAALRKYPNDKGGNLAGIEAMRLAESEPLKAAALIETVARRKAVNPAHHAAYFAASASARMGRAKEAVDWLREAAETGFPCYPLFARDPNLDSIRSDPIFQGFMADLQKRSAVLRKAMFPDRQSSR
jgi:TolB-like protein/tetratricopeptide (TPR) repeat protein